MGNASRVKCLPVYEQPFNSALPVNKLCRSAHELLVLGSGEPQKKPVGCIPHKSVSRRVCIVARGHFKTLHFTGGFGPQPGEAGAGGISY